MTPEEQRVERVRLIVEGHIGIRFTYPDAEALVAMLDQPHAG